MWGNIEENIFNPFKKAAKSKPETLSQEEIWMSSEMCDVCGHSYPMEYIHRVPCMGGRSKSKYIVRCCPNCNPQTIIPIL